ncbi:hypothetical protein DH2020_039247 [Rehmannia glutinosa]|uniref:Very-long-chain aldehyde decarbonylase CER1-like C-terminal domain-containing protein n=1 Tax=Rehmannia glutinosa TaxID=99300 RepID=A0ABR0UWU7_REHGL
MAAPLYAWPWEFLGDYKCALYGIFLAKGLYSRYQEQTFKDSNWCLHIFIICMLRLFLHQAWTSYSNMLFLTRNRRIIKEGVDFKQIDEEWHCWTCHIFGTSFIDCCDWDTDNRFVLDRTWIVQLNLRLCFDLRFSEMLRPFKCGNHSSSDIRFDPISQISHLYSNVITWPRYHSLHHAEMGTNYCLFMPFFDALGNTLNKKSWQLHKKNSLDSGKNSRFPDFVFLAHVVDMSSAAHTPFAIRSVASLPYCTRIYLIPLLPVTFVAMLMMWAKSKYFLPFAAEGINKQIEEAILRANRLGVKVISLAALNKNEALNGGGTLFVDKHPNLNVRVVHGNTLTAAVILNEIPKDVREVFLTGATSKLGRAIALYLCRNKVRVLMLTLSNERFRKIQEEAAADCQQYLIQYTMDRGVVHACHAGGVVHALEGWTHHEVGAINVDRIDLVWKAALKHGLKPVSNITSNF